MAYVENPQVPPLDKWKHTIHKGSRNCDLLLNYHRNVLRGPQQWNRAHEIGKEWPESVPPHSRKCMSSDWDPWSALSHAICKTFTKDHPVITCIHDVCSAQRIFEWCIRTIPKKEFSICKLLHLWEREGNIYISFFFIFSKKKKSQPLKQNSSCELVLMLH